MRDYDQVLRTARKAFASGRTKSLDFRRQQLKNVLRLLLENETEILDALHQDLRKCSFEGKLGESENLKNEVKVMIRDLEKNAADESLPLNCIAFLDRGYVRKEPYGVVLILGTWNYPINLSLQPLVGALAAGNCVILKPSEVAPTCAALMAKLLPRYIDNECYQVVCGGAEETQQLLLQKFDYIFYTGSATVGRIVATAAAQHVTPVTLELGGKSPCYIDNDADFRMAAKRILWGKVMNLGMTCIAPDYVLCSKQVETEFVKVAQEVFYEWYGESLQKCPDLPRIPSKTHFNRLKKLLEGTNGKIAYGGQIDDDDLWISPTIVVGVNESDTLMAPENEIFGPILPIYIVDNIDGAIQFINARPKPLAAYIFSRRGEQQKKYISQTSSGGVCVNDVIWHNIWPNLPFGGVGESGYGNYHGKYSFDTFSHKRAVLVRGFSYFSEKLGERRYPPYTDEKLKFFIFIIRFFDFCNLNIQNINSGHFFAAALGALFVLFMFYVYSAMVL